MFYTVYYTVCVQALNERYNIDYVYAFNSIVECKINVSKVKVDIENKKCQVRYLGT